MLALVAVLSSLFLPGLATTAADAATTTLTMTAPSRQALFPAYSSTVRDYAMYSCQSRPVTLTFSRSVTLNGRNSKTHTVTIKPDTAIPLRVTDNGRSTEHTLRCLADDFPRVSYKRVDPTLDGNLVLVTNDNQVGNTLIIADENGVPLWYRHGRTGSQPHLVKRLPDGQLEIMMVRGEEPATGPVLEATNDVYILRVDLQGKVSRAIRPYENGKRIPIDNHGFQPLTNGYYFMSTRITSTDTEPRTLSADYSVAGPEKQALVKLCRTADRWKTIGTRIVRTDAKGEVNWSYDMPTVNSTSMPSPTWTGAENGVRTCYIDEHHPNWISLDPTKNQLYVSLRNSGVVVAIDVASKKVLWTVGGWGLPGGLRVSGDPLTPPDGGTHSGSMNRKGELLLFDNRSQPADTGRGLLYSVNAEKMTAKFVAQFLPPRDRCTTTAGKIYCPTRVMGNATFTDEDDVIVDWGDKDGNPNLFSIFDRTGKLLLDARDEGLRIHTYKSEFVASKLPKGREWITSSIVLNATNEKTARSLTG